MNYLKLLLMATLSFISMYILMYSMVDVYANIYPNFNQLYMAGLMTIPMILIELVLMKSMYANQRLNSLIIFSSVILFVLFFWGIRKQAAISDKEFLKSMIPHHASALLMCKEAHLKDEELKKLCQNIKKTQQEEIDFMKAKLAKL